MEMKQILRSILPLRVINWLRRLKNYLSTSKETRWWKKKALHFSGFMQNNEKSRLASLMVTCHVLEKGLTMPERRLGFGQQRVREIIELCMRCVRLYGAEHTEIQAAIADLKQYKDIHKDGNYELSRDILTGIDDLLPFLNIQDQNCYVTDKDSFFDFGLSFIDFAKSRHSIRWFAETEVDMKKLKKAIQLAQTAPSACNRQATRVKIIKSEKGRHICCKYQNGNRGFGDKARVWLLISSEMGAWECTHTDIALVDAGIFAMNLLYALHFYGFVACPLNAHIKIEDRDRLFKELGVPLSELPALFVLVGNINPLRHIW